MLQIGFRAVGIHKECDAFVAFGVYETRAPEGQLKDFVLPALIAFRHGTPLTVIFDGQPYSLEQLTAQAARPLKTSIEDMTLEDILKIEAERPIMSSHSNAELVCRPTRIEPSQKGSVVYAFMGFAHVQKDVQVSTSSVYVLKCLPRELGFSRACYFLDGALGAEFRPELGEIDLADAAKGSTYEQLMRKPWWGFASEPYSLPGTYSTEVYDDLALFYGRFNEDAISDKDPDFERLTSRIAALGCDGVLRDPLFASYLKRRIEVDGVSGLVSPVPLSKFVSRQKAVEKLVNTLLQP